MHPRQLAIVLLAALALTSPTRTWGAPVGETGWIKGQIQRLRLPGRYRLARRQLGRTRAGKACKTISRRVKQGSMLVRGHLTLGMDRLEIHVSPSLARGIHRLRGLGPISLGSFALHKLRQDPVFLAGYGLLSFGFSSLQPPALIAMGVSPLTAVAVRIATGPPIDLGVLLWREHRKLRRTDPDVTLTGTLRHVGREYLQYAESRRTENRRYMARRRGAGQLRQLAAPLIEP